MKKKKRNRSFQMRRRAVLAGAVLCAAAFLMAGCRTARQTRAGYEAEETVPDAAEEGNELNDGQNSCPGGLEQTGQETDSADVGQSYNVYLYHGSDVSLDMAFPAGVFGFQMSRDNDNADRRLAEGEYIPMTIRLSEEAYEQYAAWLFSEENSYIYSDLYGIDDALAEAEKYKAAIEAQASQHTDFITDIAAIPDTEEIKSRILDNNEEFLREHPEYTRLEDAWIDMISDVLVSAVEKYRAALSQADLMKIYCMMNDIKAVGIDSADFTVNELRKIYNARVTEDGVIFLDTEVIAQLKDEQSAERTVSHEIIHLFQRMCPGHSLDGCTQIGNSLYFDSLEEAGRPNPLHFQWLYEAAAEQMSMELAGAKTPLVYKNMVGYLNTLNLITLLRPDCGADSIAAGQLSCDPDRIYEIFGAADSEEKQEIAEMLYSICYIQNDREDFEQAYEKKYGSIQDRRNIVKREMKQSVAKTMTKYFYRNLAERIAHSQVDLQDVFYLMNVFEAALNVHLIYDEEERLDLNREALEYYVAAQDELFRLLAEDSGCSEEEIAELYGAYALVIRTGTEYRRNCSLSWLTEEEREAVGDILTTDIESVSVNIRSLG